MKKRALIAEPDPEEALRQAAILQDDGYDAIVFDPGSSGADLVTELERSVPDLLVLRHERPGSQTGLALVPRLKQVAPGTAVVITTSDLTPDAIEKNRRQKIHADGYLRLPVERTELVAAARAVPQVHEAGDVAEVQAAPEADPQRPPPRPASGLRVLSQPPKASTRGGGAEVMTMEELAFIENVFSGIQHIDADAPAPEPPPPSAIGDSGDRKIVLLRSELKRRERELAKLSRLWRAREEDLRQKESRVHQKDIEIEGLRLRVAEVSVELERANENLVTKEAAFGRAIGESYDQTALEQAEYIQQVARKENELNSLKTKVRKAEDAFAGERTEFTERILEWERAYAALEQHHWQVVEASVDEVRRLESQVHKRASERKEQSVLVRARELALMSAHERLESLQQRHRSVEHAHGVFEQEMVARAHAMLVQERNAAHAYEAEGHELRARLLDVEEDLARHQRLLLNLEQERRGQIALIASVSRVGDVERVRLVGEREIFKGKCLELERTLSLARALGEATVHQLFTLEEKRRIVGEVQAKVRDEKITHLVDQSERLTSSLTDVTERLGQSEMEHTAELARAEELDRALAETRDQAADEQQRQARDIEVTTAQRDKLTDALQRSEQLLGQTKEELATARSSGRQREIEIAALVEQKDYEIAARSERLQEIERSLGDAREDITNLRKTMTLRDERITDLLSRVRQADEQQVALEGKVHRLESANHDKEADLIARDERIAHLALKVSQRHDELEVIDAALRKSEALVLDKQALVERVEGSLTAVQVELGRARDEGVRLQGELQQRGGELFDSERKGSSLTAELQNARAEIDASNAIAEQQQAQLAAASQRGTELRRGLEDSEAKLRNALVDLDGAAQRAEQMRVDVRERAAVHEGDVQAARASVLDVERVRDALTSANQLLQARFDEAELLRQSTDESLGASQSENRELRASLTDAVTHLELQQQRAVELENDVHEREGRIHAQGSILERAGAQSEQQQQELTTLREALSEATQAVDDGKTAIEERVRWLQTREQVIDELKASLDAETQTKARTLTQFSQLEQQAATLHKSHEQLKARLEERERLLAAQAKHSEAQLQQESERSEVATLEVASLRAQFADVAGQLGIARAEAQRAVELRVAEEAARADAQKLRGFAERVGHELKLSRVQLEKIDGERKQSEAAVARLRAELAAVLQAHKAAGQAVAAVRLESEQKSARMQELAQQVQRLTAAREASDASRGEAEQELARTKHRAEQDLSLGTGQLAHEVARLQSELTAVKKSRADAVGQAQQARAEAEQMKRLAADKIREVQAAARSTAPPRLAVPSSPPMTAPPPPPWLGSAHALPLPPAMPSAAHAARASAAPAAAIGFEDPSPTSASHNSSDDDDFDGDKTAIVENMHIPSAARDNKG